MRAVVFVVMLWLAGSRPCIFAGDGGQVLLSNRIGRSVDAPIFLPTGEGAGVMDGMVAQLFCEGADGGLTALQPRAKFRPPTDKVPATAAYLIAQPVDVPQASPGKEATLRLRVWESIEGCNYEQARSNLYYFGETKLTLRVGGGQSPPVPLTGLRGMILGGKEEGKTTPPVRRFVVETGKVSGAMTNWTELATLTSTNAGSVALPPFPALDLVRVTPKE